MTQKPDGKKEEKETTFMLEIDQLLQNSDDGHIKQKMANYQVKEEIHDHGNFLQTFDYFLDNLLCDFSQNVDAVKNYDQILQ